MIRRRDKKAATSTGIIAVPYGECPAKTCQDRQGKPRLGRSVFNHCQIVGETARALINRMPPVLSKALFPPGSALQAAVHDIGKVSPVFFLKLLRAIAGNDSPWLHSLAPFSALDERQWGGHAGVSQLALAAISDNRFVARVAGQHHGFNPPPTTLSASAEVLGGTAWQAQRQQLVEALQQAMGETFPDICDPEQARLLAGLTTVADWIGSGSLFEDPAEPWQEKIEQALDQAGFITPLIRNGRSFGDIFHDHNGVPLQPNVCQVTFYQHCKGPGVYVLEAPMGLGKTEAALYAAYQVLEGNKACGIYFALPTQLTSNKILERFNTYLQAILAPESHHSRSLLLHGNAWLVQSELGEEGRPGHSWFHSAKRGLLAPFAVGTLDQALMAAMNVKHGFVRAFGLAGKVVILDEVHSYDAYTSVILDELIDLLRKLHCTVIILSATLCHARRAGLLGLPMHSEAYPLITASAGVTAASSRELPVSPGTSQHVILRLMPMADPGLFDALLERAAQGQQILWIENSVAEAQERYLDLAARAQELGVACGLLHSRFTTQHRQRNENRWVGYYGKTGREERGKQGRILIGTQVLEQSLDIDADFLITRIAPTDMLLQRLGRLWRHEDTPRVQEAQCEAWILAPAAELARENPHGAFGATAYVYSPYMLCRTLEVWQEQARKGSLSLPGDIRPLVEATWQERVESQALARWKHELFAGSPRRKGVNSLRQLARITLSTEGKTLPEAKAQTRYSEQESSEILLLSRLHLDENNKLTTLTFLDGEQVVIPWRQHQLDKSEWRRRAALITRHLVSCRQSQLPRPPVRSWCQKAGLGHVLYLGHPQQDEAGIALALVTPGHKLAAIDGSALPLSTRYIYSYRDDIGLKIDKIKE